MKFNFFIIIILSVFSFYSCADYKSNTIQEKKYFSSKGFALIYEDVFFEQKVVNKKIGNEKVEIMHDFLKLNTQIKIINPENQKFLSAKVNKKSKYPNIFNIVINQKAANLLDLDINNPYVEVLEVKKNKTFIAKKSNTFDEEKNVAEKAPVEKIVMNNIAEGETEVKKKNKINGKFIILINDFYYFDTAENLQKELLKKSNISNISIKKINEKKYRLFVGPFANFNALKTTYISLNNLGFEDLDVYKE